MLQRTFSASIALATLLACGGSGDSATGPKTTGIRVVAGAPITDTVGARPLQALVVDVLVDGQPRQGLVLRFESMPSADTSRRFEQAIAVAKISQNFFSNFASDTTNSSGRAGVLVQLGTVAGEARVLVSCPELGLADTARFTVLPGNAARLLITVRDTAVLAGGSYNVGAQVTDRYGNKRADPVTLSAGPNTASVDPAGRVTVGSAVGRGAIAVKAGGAADSARFTVLPAGTMAFLHYLNGVGSIATARMDGSALKLITAATTPAYPNISPSGDLIAYQQQESGGYVLYVVDGTGAAKQLVDVNLVRSQQFAHFSGDGRFIYFTGYAPGEAYSVWRVRADGTALTKIVTTSSASYSGQPFLGVSRDGSRIAYAEYSGITILNLATGAKTLVSASSTFLEFSPDSKQLAYLNGAIVVVNVDGTSPKSMAGGLVSYDPGLTWLPGSSWLLVRGYFGPLIANASTGEVDQVPFGAFYQMSAQP